MTPEIAVALLLVAFATLLALTAFVQMRQFTRSHRNPDKTD